MAHAEQAVAAALSEAAADERELAFRRRVFAPLVVFSARLDAAETAQDGSDSDGDVRAM
jgi:hypothetical protein